MFKNLEIKKAEYLNMLRNRGESVSSDISFYELLEKVKYVKKRDLKHLLAIRDI